MKNMNEIKLTALDEEFRPVEIKGKKFERYLISNYGRLYSLYQNKILKPWHNKKYCSYALYQDKKVVRTYAHRLVAYAFVLNPNPEKFTHVNHKDERPWNNYWKNLEWCDRSYNQKYGTASQRKREKIGIAIRQLDLQQKEVATFDSIRQASIALGMSVTPIHSGVRDGLPHKGYYWQLLNPRCIA